jgi:2-iminobutanoate/2-iminopropanoate deaminase
MYQGVKKEKTIMKNQRKVIISEKLPPLKAPYSHGVQVGGWVFTAGVLGVDTGGNLVGITPGRPDFESQLRQALQNITTILEALGTSPDRVAKVKAYITDFRSFDRYNSTYREFFTPPYPARASIGAGLARENAIIEVEAIATVSGTLQEVRSPVIEGWDTPVAKGGIRVGDLLCVGGRIARDAKGQLVGRGDIKVQAEQTLDNVGATLEAAGFEFSDVIKINATVPDWHGLNQYNEILAKYVAEPFPTGATIQGQIAREGMLIEIEAVAARGAKRFASSEVAGVSHFALKRREDTIYVRDLPGSLAPQSHAVQCGDFVYLSGEVGRDVSGRLVGPGDIRAQTRKTMENIYLCMEALGGTLADIVKVNATISDYRLFPAFNEEYATFFSPPYPARTTVVTGLGQGDVVIEVEAIAVLGASRDASFVTGPSGS